MIATPIVDWSALAQVVLYSLAGGVIVPAIFALSIRAAARSSDESGGATGVYALLSALGGLVCIGSIVVGILVLTSK